MITRIPREIKDKRGRAENGAIAPVTRMADKPVKGEKNPSSPNRPEAEPVKNPDTPATPRTTIAANK
jgi:hypothetical protein